MNHKHRSSSRQTRRPFILSTSLSLLAMASLSHAVTLTWDTAPGVVGPGDSAITGGIGTWNLTNGNWTADGGVNNVAWTNGDSAIFQGTGDVVTLGAAVIADDVTFSGDDYEITGGTLTLAGTPLITTSADAIISAVLAGSDGFTKTGTAQLTLSGANTFTGTMILDQGALVLSSTGGAAIHGDVQMGSGVAGNQPNLRMAANNQFGTGVVMTFVNPFGSFPRFDVQGTQQTLAGIVDSTGAGVIQNERIFGGGTTADGTLTLNGTGTYSYNGYLRDEDDGGHVFKLHLVKDGAGTQVLSGANVTYQGTTTVNAGTLELQTTANFASAVTVNSGGTLKLNNTATVTGVAFSVNIASGGTLNFTTTNTTVDANRFQGAITGTGTIVKEGTGWYHIQGAAMQNFAGTINVMQGRFGNSFNTSVWTSSTADAFVAAGAELDLRTDDIILDQLTGSGNVVNTFFLGETNTLTVGVANGSSQFDGQIRGNRVGANNTSTDVGLTALRKVGTGTFTLTNTSSNYSGPTTVDDGLLVLQSTRLITGAKAANGTGVLEINSEVPFATRWNNAGAISGNGTINKTGSGVFGITGAMNFTGTINILAGRLHNDNVTGNWSASTADVNVSPGAVLDLRANDILVDELNGSGEVWNSHPARGGDTLFVGVANGSSQFDGNILGNASQPADNPNGALLALTKRGTGTFTLTGAGNIYSGATTIENGILRISGGDNRLPLATNLTVQGGATFGGTFDMNGLNQTVGALSGVAGVVPGVVIGGGTLTVNGTTSTTFAGNITGATALTKAGTSTLALSGASSHSGATLITGGAIRHASATAFSPNSNIQLNGGVIEAGIADLALTLGTNPSQVQFLGSGGFSAFGAARNITLNGGGTLTWASPGFVPDGSNLLFGSATADNTASLTNDLDLGGGIRTVQLINGPAAIEGALAGTVSNGTLTILGGGTARGMLAITGQITADTIVGNGATGSTNLMAVVLSRPGGNAIVGGLQIGTGTAAAGNFATIRNGASEQIADTTVVTFGGPADAWSYWNLYGFNETIRGITNSNTGGVIQLVEGDPSPTTNSTITLNVPTGENYSYFGHIRDRSTGDTTDPGGFGRLAFIKTGGGTQSLATFNTQRWTGETIVREGTLSLVLNNGLVLPGQITIDAATLDADATLDLVPNAGQTFTIAGNILGTHGASGAALLRKSGPSTAVLTGTNTFAGTTEITGGTLRISGAAALSPNSNIQINGGVLELGIADFTSPLGTGGGQVRWTGSGGFSAFGANRIVNIGGAGAPAVWAAGSFVPDGSTLILSGPQANATTLFTNPIDLASGSRRIASLGGTAAVDAELQGDISNGSLTLAPANGTIQVVSQISADVTVESGNTAATNHQQVLLNRPGGNAINGNLQIGTAGPLDPATFSTVRLQGSEQIADTGVLTFGGSNNRWSYFNLNGLNETVRGVQNLPDRDGGVLQLVEADPSPATDSTLTFNVPTGESYSYLGHIRDRANGITNDPGGNGRLNFVKDGPGSQSLTTWNTQVWSGTTTVNAGTLSIALGGFTGGGGTLSSPATVASGATLDFRNAPNFNWWGFNSTLSGGGTVTKSGGSIVNLIGSGITYTGPTSVNEGVLRLTDATAFASSAATISAPGVLEIFNNGAQSFATPTTGPGRLVKNGPGTLTLAGTLGHTGETSIRGGVLLATAANQFPASGTIAVGDAATLNLGGFDHTVGAVAGSRDSAARIVGGGPAAASLTVNLTSGQSVFGGNFGGPGANENNLALIKQGAGTLTLTGASTHNGGTVIEGGTIQLGASTTMPLSASAFSIWLDGADPDGTGTAPADGSPISVWVNKGTLGAAGDFTAQPGREPSYNTTGALPVVSFTADAVPGFSAQAGYDKLVNNLDFTNGPTTIIVAGRYAGATGDEHKRLVSGMVNNWLLGWWNNGMDSAYYTSGFVPGTVAPDTNFHTYSAVIRGDGTADTYSEFGRIGSGPGVGPNGLALGGGANYTTQNTENSTGDIGELFIVRGDMADADRAAIEAYLARKWTGFVPTNPLPVTGTISLVNPGATLAVNGATQTAGSISGVAGTAITLGGGTLIAGNDGANALFDGIVSGPGVLGKKGAGTWTLTGAHTYTGVTRVQGGILDLVGGPDRLPAAATLEMGGGTSSATLRLNGNNQTVAGLSATGDPTITTSRIVGGATTSATLTVNLTAGTNTFSGIIGGPGVNDNNISLTKTGAGTLILSNSSTYSGDTVITGGTLRLGGARALPSNPVIWLDATDGATINTSGGSVTSWTNKGSLGASGDFSAPLNSEPAYVPFEPLMGNNPVIRFDALGAPAPDQLVNPLNFPNDVTIAYIGRLSGAANQRLLAATGNNWLLGTWGGFVDRAYFGNGWVFLGPTLDTNAHFYLGTVSSTGLGSFYSNGTLLGTAPGMAGPNALSIGGGYLNTGTEFASGDVGELLVFNGVISETDRATLDSYIARKWFGIGTFDILPPTTNVSIASAGATLDLNGVIQTIASLSGVAGSHLTLSEGTLIHTGTADTVFAGDISGPGTFTKTGSGILELSGTNTPTTGLFTVAGGTVLVTGSLSGSIVEVQSGGTLGGDGIIGSEIYVFSGGILSPGASPGTLTVTGPQLDISDAVFASNSQSLVFELGATSDRVNLTTGQLSIGTGVLEFDDFAFSAGPGFGPGSYTLFDTTQDVFGSLGPGLSGTIGAFAATLSLADADNDIILTVVPEPGSAVLLLGGLALLGARRRRRA